MSLVRAAEGQSKRLNSKRTRTRSVTATDATERLLQRFPIEMRNTVLKNALADGGRVVAKAAKSNLRGHRSSNTGTREEWSEKVRRKRQGQKDLFQSIRVASRVYSRSTMAIVGARWPYGAHAHLVEFGGVFPRWGKVSTYQRPRPFMRPAAQQTERQQSAAIIRRVRREWKKV